MLEKIKGKGIYRRILFLVISCCIMAFAAMSGIFLYTMKNVESTLLATETELGEDMGEFVWQDSQKRGKEHLAAVAAAKAQHIDRELSMCGEDVASLAKSISLILSSPENYLPRSLPNPRTEKDILSGTVYVHYCSALMESGISPELMHEIGIASNVADTLSAMEYHYRDYETSLFVASRKGYFICMDILPQGGAVFLDDELRQFFLTDFDPRERPWYRLAEERKELVYTDTFRGADGTPDLSIAMPYYDADGFAGVVGIGLDEIYSQVADTAIGDTGFSFVLNEQGDIAFSARKSGVLAEHEERMDLRKTDDPGLSEAAKRMVAGESGVASVIVDGHEYYLAFAPVKSIGWSFGTLIEKDEIKAGSFRVKGRILEEMEGFRDLLQQIFSASLWKGALVLLLLALFFIYVSSKAADKITNPIQELMGGVREIAGGNLDKKLAIHTSDEIEELAECFNDMTDDLKNHIKRLSEEIARQERTRTELEFAANIQAGMLPGPPKKRPEFDLGALMHPAKEVGGDFYDFYFVGEDYLAITVADVSGKGVPAALFMVIAKTLLKEHVIMAGSAEKLDEAMKTVNDALARSNPECMFVTVFLGLLHLPTGVLTYVNAGHNPPLVRSGEASSSEHSPSFEFLPYSKYPVLGFQEGIAYSKDQLVLSSGDALFLYTDGVTEAMNGKGEMFSEKRLKETLTCVSIQHGANLAPGDLLAGLQAAIGRHVGTVEQSDDITMLGLVFHGSGKKGEGHE